MEPQLIEYGPLTVVGIEVRTRNSDEADPSAARIPGLWQTFFGEGISSNIADSYDGGPIVAVYHTYESDHNGRYTLLVGRKVPDASDVDEELKVVNVPRGRYLKFVAEGAMPAALVTAWKGIWEYFAATKDYTRAYSKDLELYSDGRVEVLVAVE